MGLGNSRKRQTHDECFLGLRPAGSNLLPPRIPQDVGDGNRGNGRVTRKAEAGAAEGTSQALAAEQRASFLPRPVTAAHGERLLRPEMLLVANAKSNVAAIMALGVTPSKLVVKDACGGAEVREAAGATNLDAAVWLLTCANVEKARADMARTACVWLAIPNPANTPRVHNA